MSLISIRIPFFIVLSCVVAACSRSDSQTEVPATQLNSLLAQVSDTTVQPVCKKALLDVGNDLIGKKQHFLRPVDGAQSEVARFSGVLHYNDRPSHISFAVEPLNVDEGCVVRYDLNYQFDIPCLTVREEAFKKWLHRGKLGETTQQYVHKRNPNKRAYLTNVSRNLQCLVSVHVVETVVPNKPDTKEK